MGKIFGKIGSAFRAFVGWLKRVNPILLFCIAFILTIIIPSEYSVWTQLKYNRTLDRQKHEIHQLEQNIEKTKKAQSELWIKKDRLEKFAREQYLMKEEDEEIYLLKK